MTHGLTNQSLCLTFPSCWAQSPEKLSTPCLEHEPNRTCFRVASRSKETDGATNHPRERQSGDGHDCEQSGRSELAHPRKHMSWVILGSDSLGLSHSHIINGSKQLNSNDCLRLTFNFKGLLSRNIRSDSRPAAEGRRLSASAVGWGWGVLAVDPPGW